MKEFILQYNSQSYLLPEDKQNGEKFREHSFLQDISKNAYKNSLNRKKRMEKPVFGGHSDNMIYRLEKLPIHPSASSPSPYISSNLIIL